MPRVKTRGISREIDQSEFVERDADGIPIAFRIWKFGENSNSTGAPDLFDEKSAELLTAQQAEVGRDFAFDFNHAMVKSVDAEENAAAGWHRIKVRDSGLWAVNCRWSDRTLGFFKKDPPEYRYFSPTFFADEEGRIVYYVNCALTNIPATHGIPALRSAGGTEEGKTMTEAMRAFLRKMGIDPEKAETMSEEDLLTAAAAAREGDPEETEEREGDDPEETEEREEEGPPSSSEAPTAAAARSLSAELPEVPQTGAGALPLARAASRPKVAVSAAVQAPQAPQAPSRRAQVASPQARGAASSAAPAPRNTRARAAGTFSGSFHVCTSPRTRSALGLPERPTADIPAPVFSGDTVVKRGWRRDPWDRLVMIRSVADQELLDKSFDNFHLVKAQMASFSKGH